jgi:hypothetical protein
MTAADITFAVFTFCNTVRVLAYVPQITRAARDQNGAEAVSFATWGLFLVCNASAVAYAGREQGRLDDGHRFHLQCVRLCRDPPGWCLEALPESQSVRAAGGVSCKTPWS